MYKYIQINYPRWQIILNYAECCCQCMFLLIRAQLMLFILVDNCIKWSFGRIFLAIRVVGLSRYPVCPL